MVENGNGKKFSLVRIGGYTIPVAAIVVAIGWIITSVRIQERNKACHARIETEAVRQAMVDADHEARLRIQEGIAHELDAGMKILLKRTE